MTGTALSTLLVGIASAAVAALGAVLGVSRRRSRIKLLERLAKLEPSLDGEALVAVKKLQAVLAAKLLAHYAFPASATIRNAALGCVGVGALGVLAWEWLDFTARSNAPLAMECALAVSALAAVLAVVLFGLWPLLLHSERRQSRLAPVAPPTAEGAQPSGETPVRAETSPA
ncbi:hypothetical protein [Frondihabitans australicus]|uniref:Uncharacterized protein n=1 Tax=Frondihabitans australicus TaxID=386892 RepID=A0A495IEA3_9MICO|nr:hypothetical protein [Frondihabitans australicus]RKR73980.1 hypothetical protein C8E83_1081 [Frondihabitans australicus]